MRPAYRSAALDCGIGLRRGLQGRGFILILAGALLTSPAGWAPASLTAAESDIRRDATVEAVEQVMPCVVNIATETIVPVRDPFEEFFQQFWSPYHRRQPQNSYYSLGSGVVIDEAGYLLTNDHVVRRADKIQVKFCTGTNVYDAAVVASDPKSDVALLKLKAAPNEKFQAIKFARDDDLLLGETVLALGNPFGLGGSVTRGILSSKSRSAPKAGETLDYPNWLQTDAPINPGNSGGPLVNLRGELIGINVGIVRDVQGLPAQGIGFAIPTKLVIGSLSDIIPGEYVKSYWFGARVKVGTSPLVVTTVQPDSPAGKAGLKSGDTILEVNGKAPKSFIDFADLLATNARAEVTLTIQRASGRSNIPMRLVPEKTVFNADLIRDKLGLGLGPMTAEAKAIYGGYVTDGWVITEVQKDSPADAAGLQTGLVVTAFDAHPPTNLTDLAKQLYAKKKGDRVQLELTVRQRLGRMNVLQQGVLVDLTVR